MLLGLTRSPASELAKVFNLPRREQRALEALTSPLHLPEGEVLIVQGDSGRETVLLLAGELLVERDGVAVATLTAGAIVGEQALLLHEPRNATVTAATDVTVAVMNRREFGAMLDQCPTLGRQVLHTAIARGAAAVRSSAGS